MQGGVIAHYLLRYRKDLPDAAERTHEATFDPFQRFLMYWRAVQGGAKCNIDKYDSATLLSVMIRPSDGVLDTQPAAMDC